MFIAIQTSIYSEKAMVISHLQKSKNMPGWYIGTEV